MPLEFKKRAVRTENFSGNVNILQTQLNLFLKKKKPVVTTKDNLTIETPIGFLFNKAVEKIKTSINPADYHFFIEHLPSSAPKDLRFIDKIDIARNALHTSRCVQLAKAILFDLIPVNLKGKDLGEAFLINYDYLFEHFIAHVLMTSKAGYLFSKPKIPTKYAEFFKDEKVNEKEVLPDIAYNEMNVGLKIKYNGVLDVKNKYPSIFSNGDVFQVLYYSQKFNSDRAILIYPSAETQCYTKLELEEKIPVEVYACYFNIKSLSDGSFVKERERFADEILSLLC
ncbi:McrBC 5-methylcytosine restriction system component [Pontibacter chinhatensis]|uniref:McrBC 5-methylcytosine restriction system component n=2 Tax=Pontibacter chinhatensis TaxID=1436961 RepID=A0A1I2ZT88_9BACT|nr:McrBC 5-methylcytosine restriction system component [Pontibacter chinhatensis]